MLVACRLAGPSALWRGTLQGSTRSRNKPMRQWRIYENANAMPDVALCLALPTAKPGVLVNFPDFNPSGHLPRGRPRRGGKDAERGPPSKGLARRGRLGSHHAARRRFVLGDLAQQVRGGGSLRWDGALTSPMGRRVALGIDGLGRSQRRGTACRRHGDDDHLHCVVVTIILGHFAPLGSCGLNA
jgi:hypothetical protein